MAELVDVSDLGSGVARRGGSNPSIRTILHGIVTAIVTPFREGVIDFDALDKIVNYQIHGGVYGIVVAGSTGEGIALDMNEYRAMIAHVVSIVGKRVLVIAGVCGSHTLHSVELANIAEQCGVDALMCTTPYYSRPPQRCLYQHFEIIHANTHLPIMVYTIPRRTGVDLTDDTIIALASLPRIVAIKDGSGDMERPLRIGIKAPKLTFLAADDSLMLASLAQGCSGIVSVASNIVIKEMVSIYKAWEHGDTIGAQKELRYIWPLLEALFLETNPIVIKYALSLMGLCLPELRAPLCALENTKIIHEILPNYVKIVI